jgi:hypothetical protein
MSNNKWSATALLFSGRQNPEWLLTPVQQQHWAECWQNATSTNVEMEFPSRLGYAGCILHFDEHSYWQLYDGHASFNESGRKVFKKDEKRKMEFYLLDTAPADVKKILKEQGII